MKHEDVLKRLRQDPEYVAAEEELAPILTIAEDVLTLRLAKGWSQTELAQRAGTKQANISKLENGLGNPTLGFLHKVARALETDLTIHIGPEQQTVTTQSTVIELKIQTVQPEALWQGERTKKPSPTQWSGFLPAGEDFQPVEHYEAA